MLRNFFVMANASGCYPVAKPYQKSPRFAKVAVTNLDLPRSFFLH